MGISKSLYKGSLETLWVWKLPACSNTVTTGPPKAELKLYKPGLKYRKQALSKDHRHCNVSFDLDTAWYKLSNIMAL